ncbi:MAG: SIMPL domain-containing protein [Gaiellales bacterium]
MPTPRQIAILAATAVLAIAAYRAVGQGSGTARAASQVHSGMPAFIRFTGTGTVHLRPDRSTISISTSGRGATLGAATNQASAAMQHVIAAMQKDGVASADMQTTDASGGREGKGSEPYRAHQSLDVTVRNVGNTGKLLADATSAGATATSGPSFSLASRHEGRSAAIAAAVADARDQAEAAAKAAGLHLGGVISISANGGGYPVYAESALYAAPAAVKPVPIQRGTQEVTETLTVTFAELAG